MLCFQEVAGVGVVMMLGCSESIRSEGRTMSSEAVLRVIFTIDRLGKDE